MLRCAGHTNNLHDTCLWELIEDGKTESEALELLEVGRFNVHTCALLGL